ncbi:MAG: glutamate--tRNA ligase [Bacillota bacterium]|nr:glutamate--tRNA ligase [Bacillota bacterium]
MSNVRVRFAPSPTGYLHLGGARTALFNWLFARHHGGVFVLRIEDTDRQRSTEASVRAITDGLRWLGLDWDEGPGAGGAYGPYFQSQRQEAYRQAAASLLERGLAYRCYCTPEELEERRKQALAEGRAPRYDRRCLRLGAAERERLEREGRRPALRLLAPDEGITVVHDLVRGDVEFANAAVMDDFVIVKSDGFPTYNFAAVVDDAAMRITHVLRAEEHLSNTPKQLAVYRALGLEPPAFGHLPMILAPDRSKLSKRHGAIAVEEFRDRGYLPEAMVNYLALLGWSPGGEEEFFTRDELVARFDLDRVSRQPAIYDVEKLTWMNAHYLREADLGRLADLTAPFLERAGLAAPGALAGPGPERQRLEGVLAAGRDRVRTLGEVPEAFPYFWRAPAPEDFDPKGVRKHFLSPAPAAAETGAPALPPAPERLRAAAAALESLPAWDEARAEAAFRALCEARGWKTGQLFHPVRLAVSGRTVGPSLFALLTLLPRQEVVRRLRDAARWIEEGRFEALVADEAAPAPEGGAPRSDGRP